MRKYPVQIARGMQGIQWEFSGRDVMVKGEMWLHLNLEKSHILLMVSEKKDGRFCAAVLVLTYLSCTGLLVSGDPE